VISTVVENKLIMPNAKLNDYQVLSVIGTGSYGTCKKIQRKSDKKVRVWKELDYGTMSDSEKQLLVSEVNLLRELKHDNIVRYHDRIIDKDTTKIYIIMEYCEGGDLAQLVNKHKKERKFIEETFVWKVLHQLSSALQECHSCTKASTVLHRDLKPANVFLDVNNNCKLGDFGLARVLHHDTSFAKTFVGTPYYMSPELVNRSSYNEKSDIWSLGCLIYELCSLVPPFLAANQRLLAMKIQEGHFKPIPNHFSKDLQKIIERMLIVTEDRRPTIETILTSQIVKRNMTTINSQQQKTSIDQSGTLQLLQRKEELLKIREVKLDEREQELDRRERLLVEREHTINNQRTVLSLNPVASKRNIYKSYTDKENDMRRNNILDNRTERALRFLDQNHIQENRYRGGLGLR